MSVAVAVAVAVDVDAASSFVDHGVDAWRRLRHCPIILAHLYQNSLVPSTSALVCTTAGSTV
jgi:hypothetical protein